jgi:hypothetical protein
MIPAMEHSFVRELALVLVIVAGACLAFAYALFVAFYVALTVFSVFSNLFPFWD